MDKKQEKKYLTSLNDKERKAYEIAKQHLKSSFNIQKSIGYINYNSK